MSNNGQLAIILLLGLAAAAYLFTLFRRHFRQEKGCNKDNACGCSTKKSH